MTEQNNPGQQGWPQQGAVPPQQPYYYPPRPPDHPSAQTVLILGILGIALCGIAAPFAWQMGNRVLREIDASGGQLGGRDQTNIGRILGIVGSVMLIAGVVIFGGMALLQLIVFAGVAASGG